MDSKTIQKALAASVGDIRAPLPQDGQNAPAGVVLAANEQSTFSQSHFSEALTGYIAGYPEDEGLQKLLDDVSPPVQVPRRFEYRKSTKVRGLAESDDVRALDGQFKEVTSYGSLESSRTLNKGLTFIVDRDRYPGNEQFEQAVIAWLRGMLLRQEILRGLALLSASATKHNVAWTTASNPDSDLALAIAGAADVDGLEKNAGLIGSTMLLARKLIYLGKENSSALVARSSMSLADLAEFLELEDIRRISARQKSGGSYPPIYRNSAIFYNLLKSPMIDDPSHIKRAWSPVEGGGMWRVYREERGPKILALSLEHYSQHIAPFTSGVVMVTDTNSGQTPAPPKTTKN